MIPQISKILYATDLSKNSAYTFQYVIDIAQARKPVFIIPLPEKPIDWLGI
jgi:DNA anti-recombination protein RmuC